MRCGKPSHCTYARWHSPNDQNSSWPEPMTIKPATMGSDSRTNSGMTFSHSPMSRSSHGTGRRCVCAPQTDRTMSRVARRPQLARGGKATTHEENLEAVEAHFKDVVQQRHHGCHGPGTSKHHHVTAPCSQQQAVRWLRCLHSAPTRHARKLQEHVQVIVMCVEFW